MLNVMRKYAGSWIIKVLLAAIVVVFVFWGVGNFKSRNAAQVASVNDDIIGLEEYQKVYDGIVENYLKQFGDKIDKNMLKQLPIGKQALEQLINKTLLLQEAEKLGIQVTDQELSELIRNEPRLQSNGKFDKRLYTAFINQQRLSFEEFEENVKQDLTINKLQRFLISGVKVSEDESLKFYEYENLLAKIEYIEIKPERYTDLELSDEDVKSYYEKNKEKYRTDPKIKVQYLVFDPKTFASDVKVTDDEVSEYYDDHSEEFHKEKTVEARHILFKVDPNAGEEADKAAKKKANEVLDKARQGMDFAELAKTYSEGPSKSSGGALGAFSRDSGMVKPFADAAFALKAGEISNLVKTQFGWHIIKVEKVNPEQTEPLEKASAKIRAELISARSKNLAYDRAEEVYHGLIDGEDITKVAEKQKLKVSKTGFFSQMEPDEGVDVPDQFASTAFELEMMDISEVKELGDNFYIIQPVEKIESKIPALKDVKDRVALDLKTKKQEESAEKDAKSIIEKLKKGDNFSAAAADFKLKAIKSGFFKRQGDIPEIGHESIVTSTAFELNDQNRFTQKPLNGGHGYYVLRLLEKKQADPKGFEKQKAQIQEQLLRKKRNSTFETFLTNLKSRSRITIQEKMIK